MEEIDPFLIEQEEVINEALLKLRASRDDNERLMANEELITEVEAVLAHPASMDYPFDKFQTMSTIRSPDGAFRLFNWNVEDDNMMHKHYCYLIRPKRGNKENQVIQLFEDKITIPKKPEGMLSSRNWYGAIYYNIVPIKKGNKTYYTVFGYNGNDRSTNMKILDVFYFKGKTLRMGYPLFQESVNSPTYLRRVFFEYSEKASITMNINPSYDAIVFDHLVPETPNLSGMYDFYIPDMSYDGYKWGAHAWIYQEDLIVGNNPNKKIKYFDPDNKGDRDKGKEVANKWVDPVDGGAPVNSGGVDAIAPLDKVEETKDKKNKNGKSNTKEKKFRLFGWYKKPHSAIGDSKAEKRTKKEKKDKERKPKE
jgi:hypothetical protein